LAYKPRHKEGYFPVPPTDSQQDIRTEMIVEMRKAGIVVEKQHHEVATAGQAEIDMRYDSLVRMADKMLLYKYIVKNVARRHGKTVTFMPKPLFGDNGTGMHTHQSIWKAGKPLFAGGEYAGMSKLCLNYIGGILKHAPALAAFTNPTMNSYKRLTPGFEAPVFLAYSSRNRSASVRIPMYSASPKAKRIEVRFPDPSCNPYLSFSAMLMAGLDGIVNKINPGKPMDKDLYDMAYEINRLVSDTTIKTRSQAVMAAVDAVVLHERHTNAYTDVHGITIYHISKASQKDADYTYYRATIDFALTTAWDEFLNAYAK